MPTGRDLVKKALSTENYQGGLGTAFAALDVAQIAAADNKTKALLTTLKDLVAFNLFGWAGMISGSLLGIRTGIKALIVDSGSLQKALENLSRLRMYEAQFAPFLKGVGSARQRLAELMTLAGKPFNLSSLVTASRALEIFTRGAYSSDAALRTIVDSAARAGQGVETISETVGQLYASLRDGQPIHGTAEELIRLGTITPQIARQLEQMQERGAPLGEMFSVVTREMERSQGAGKEASDSVEALSAQYEEAKTKLNQAFTGNFLDSQIEGTKNTIAVMEQLTPVAEKVGRALGGIITFGENLVSMIGRAATAVPGLATAAGVLTRAFVFLGAALTGVTLVRWASVLATAAPYVLAAARNITTLNASLRAQTAAYLTSARAAVAAGTATRSQSATVAVLGNSTRATTAATTAGTVATTAATTATTTATTATRGLGAAILALPWGWIIMGVSLLIGVFSELAASEEENRKAVEELGQTGADAVNKLQEQARAMKDLDDQQDALTESTRELVAARQKLADLETSGAAQPLIDQAQQNVRNLEITQRQIGDTQGLQPTKGYQQILEQRAQQQLNLRDAAYQSQMTLASPAEQMRLRQQRINEEESKQGQGKFYQDAEEAAKRQEIPLQATINTSNQTIAGYDKDLGVTGTTEEERQKSRASIRATLQEQKTSAEENGLSDQGAGARLNVLDRQQSEVARRDAATAALRNVRLDSASDIVSGYAKADYDERRAGAMTNADQRNALLSDVAERRRQLDVKRLDITDPNRSEKIEQMKTEQVAAQRQADANGIELNAQKEIVGLRMRGMDAAEKEAGIRIAALQKQLQMQTYLDAQGKQALENRIAEEQKNLDLMREAARVQRESDAAHLRIADIDRRAVEATVGGKFGLAAKLRDQSIKESDAAANKESYNQKINSGQYSEAQARAAVGNEQKERERERESQRLEFIAQSDRAADEQRLSQSRNPEDRLKAREMGDQDTARQRISEALKANLSPEEAAKYAEKTGNLDLEKELQNNGSRGMIADSLQRIGGGGGVGGTDPSQELARRRTDLMQSIHDMIADMSKKPENGPPPTTFG